MVGLQKILKKKDFLLSVTTNYGKGHIQNQVSCFKVGFVF